MHTTDNTTSTAMADMDLDKLEALARQANTDITACARFVTTFDPAGVLQLIALARRAAQPVAPVQQNGKREGFEAAAKALQERAVGHFRNKDYKLQDECLQCASMLHDMKPAATPSPQVAEGAEDAEIAEWEGLTDLFTVIAAKHGINDIQVNGGTADDLFPRALAEFIVAASRRTAGGEVVLPAEPTDALLVACGWEEWRPGNYVDRGAATARYNAIRAAAGATPAPASAGQAAPVPLADRLMALRDEAEAERQSEVGTSRKHICEGMSLAFGAAAILAAQPAEGAGQAGQVTLCSICEADVAGVSGKCSVCWWSKAEATERAAAPADQHKRVIQFALELAEHENDDAAVSFLKAWNSEDAGYLRRNWPDFATHQPSAQDGGEA